MSPSNLKKQKTKKKNNNPKTHPTKHSLTSYRFLYNREKKTTQQISSDSSSERIKCVITGRFKEACFEL